MTNLIKKTTRAIGDKFFSFLPFLVGCAIIVSFCAITITVIVNPASLNAKDNPTIGGIVGTINTLMTMLATYFFTRRMNSTNE
ncbi:hypothetical protein [Microscilla marina]|uniref:Lipoprotein, putative n=1 Tax=Microscilla marina ATCC 23134 TaxID=313606 RepID=A1ZYQ5_MICM2|nr:hypothetical protein [Microscilla marina]EAY24479.1 lipoprotein, putative [Microscilla marina ATCC 23134]